ncbi:MAG: polysaccharide biosynthesis tyrosine autokinase [Flavobacteriales bacterium]|nr:polysaccharide biosynthesis tyrosine autokinase [Flavobacteriales bacterium]
MAASTSNDTIDLRAITRKITAKWWWFMITIPIFGALGLAYLMTTPKQFVVESVMLLGEKKRSGFSDNSEFIKGTSYLGNATELEDKIALLTSHKIVTSTLQRLGFGITYYETKLFKTQERYNYPPFIVKLDSVAVQVIDIPVHISVDRAAKTYRVWAKGENVRLYNVQTQEVLPESMPKYEIDQTTPFDSTFIGDHLSFKIDFPEDRVYEKNSDYYFILNSLEDLVTSYRNSVIATQLSKESNIVNLSLQVEVVEKGKAFLDKMMDTYIESELDKQQKKGKKTIAFIDAQIGTVADSLQKVESSMQDFRGSSNSMISAATSSDALYQDRSRLEDERSLIIRRRNYCASVLEKIRSSSDMRNVPAPSSSGIDDPVLNNLVIELTKLAADLAVQNVQTGARSNPTVIAMERKIKNLTASLAQTAEGLVEQAEFSLAEVNRRLGGISYQFSELPRQERELVNIQRKFKLSENLYNYLMEKRAEAGIAIASDQVDKSIVDQARMQGMKHISPSKGKILGGALFLGLLLPVGLILVRDIMRDRIDDIEELKRLSRLPILAAIPASKRKRVLPDEPKSLLAESFRTARVNLQYLNSTSRRQVIGFTSSSSGEGKTFCALNLATVMAQSGKRTIIVDADMRRPNLLKSLGMTEGIGLSTWLIGEAGIDQLVQPTDIPGLDVIGAGPVPPNPLDLAESPRFAELISALRSKYDQVVVDASPLGLVSEYVMIMQLVDVTLYVVREGRTGRSALRMINEMVDDQKVGNVDLLLNGVKHQMTDGYGYYTK